MTHALPKENEEYQQLRAAIYARVSTGRQLQGYSLDQQIKLARERCQQNNWQIKYIYKEKAFSAKNSDRPKFQHLLKRAQYYEYDVLVFWKLDRFARSLKDIVNVETYLKNHNIALYSITEPFDTTTPFGRFSFRNLASAAQYEREIISERTQLCIQARAQQHQWVGRKIPIGYDKDDDGRLVVNLTEAKIVQKIFTLYTKQKSMPEVAEILNKEKIEITNKKEKEWRVWDIKRILDNQIYIGQFEVAGFQDHLDELQIIPEKLFKKTAQIKSRYRQNKKPMSLMRKQKKVDTMIEQYKEYLGEMNTY